MGRQPVAPWALSQDLHNLGHQRPLHPSLTEPLTLCIPNTLPFPELVLIVCARSPIPG